MKKKILNAISTIAMALVMFALPVFSTLDCSFRTKSQNEYTVQTRTVSADNSMDFDNYYNKIQEQCKDVKFEYDEEYNQFNLTATQEIPISALENEEVVLDTEMENISLTYQTIYDPEANLVTLFVYSNGEVSDALVGCPFTKENGEVDVVFSVDDELIYLSELQDAGVIQNCGWFSRALKKIAKVAAVVAVAVAVVAVAAVVVQVAAPVIATAVTTVVTGVSGGAAVLGSTAAAAASIASGAAAIASTTMAVAATAAVVAGTAYVASEIANVVESKVGTLTINDTYTIGQEEVDESTKELVKKIAKTATILTLREMGRSYHIAFVVSQKFSDDGLNYNVGDLYISSITLTYDEALLVLQESKMVNVVNNITSNADILVDVAKVIITRDMTNLMEKLKKFKSNGYFSSKAQGIYAESPTAASTLAVVAGAWIKDSTIGLVGYGGSGGYNHFHDLARTIHIWYGSKI